MNGELLETRDVVCNWTLYQITECYCSRAGWITSCYDCNTYYQYEWVCSGSYSGGGGGGGGSTPPSSDSDPDDNINPIEALISPIFECLYNEFMKGNYSLFNQTIGVFKDLTNYQLNFKPGSIYDHTSWWYDGSNICNIDIYLDLNQSPINMADAILHEGIHAAMSLYVVDDGIPTGLNTVQYLQYYKTYSGYRDYADHVFIGDFYIKPIARVLRQLDSNRLPEYKYYGIVYEGIERAVEAAGVTRLVDEYSQYKSYNNEARQNSRICDGSNY